MPVTSKHNPALGRMTGVDAKPRDWVPGRGDLWGRGGGGDWAVGGSGFGIFWGNDGGQAAAIRRGVNSILNNGSLVNGVGSVNPATGQASILRGEAADIAGYAYIARHLGNGSYQYTQMYRNEVRRGDNDVIMNRARNSGAVQLNTNIASNFSQSVIGEVGQNFEIALEAVGYNVNDAIETLNNNAYPKYIKKKCGWCAKSIRLALEAGGIDTQIHPRSAKNYGPYLLKWGFEPISSTGYTPVAGDIRVFQPYVGGSIYGHINMYNGSKWVSDFVENGFWPGPGYQKNQPEYKIYRWGNGAQLLLKNGRK